MNPHLACGPGSLTFALADRFADVLAVDQEPDMIRLVTEKKAAAQVTAVRTGRDVCETQVWDAARLAG